MLITFPIKEMAVRFAEDNRMTHGYRIPSGVQGRVGGWHPTPASELAEPFGLEVDNFQGWLLTQTSERNTPYGWAYDSFVCDAQGMGGGLHLTPEYQAKQAAEEAERERRDDIYRFSQWLWPERIIEDEYDLRGAWSCLPRSLQDALREELRDILSEEYKGGKISIPPAFKERVRLLLEEHNPHVATEIVSVEKYRTLRDSGWVPCWRVIGRGRVPRKGGVEPYSVSDMSSRTMESKWWAELPIDCDPWAWAGVAQQ